jgi:hypothetical protein
MATCAASGVSLWTEGGRLRYSGAARAVNPLLPDLQRFKPALLELLTRTDAPPGTRPPDAAGGEAESPVAFLRHLRNAGAAVHLGAVGGERALEWELPREWGSGEVARAAARLDSDAPAIARRLDFEAWHWRACAAHFGLDKLRLDSAPPAMFYPTWPDFWRVQCGRPDADVSLVAMAALDAFDRHYFNATRGRIVRVVADELRGLVMGTDELREWARGVLGVEAP